MRQQGTRSAALSMHFEQIKQTSKSVQLDRYVVAFKLLSAFSIYVSRVKFRQNEELQLLTAQRQSGGERSVSTILYLIALQVGVGRAMK